MATPGTPKSSKGCPKKSKSNPKSAQEEEKEVERNPTKESNKSQNNIHLGELYAKCPPYNARLVYYKCNKQSKDKKPNRCSR